jgi:hypothetical protein
VQYDHHAFLFWAAMDPAVLPLQIYPIYSERPTPARAPGARGTGKTITAVSPLGQGPMAS